MHQIDTRNSPKQAKNEITHKKIFFQLVPLSIVKFVCLVVRPWDWAENNESHNKILRLERSVEWGVAGGDSCLVPCVAQNFDSNFFPFLELFSQWKRTNYCDTLRCTAQGFIRSSPLSLLMCPTWLHFGEKAGTLFLKSICHMMSFVLSLKCSL